MSPFYKVESKKFTQSYKKYSFSCEILSILFSLCGLLCLCVWVYHCLKCHQSSPCFQWRRNSTTSNFSVPGGLLEFFLWSQLDCHTQPQFLNFVEINLGPAHNTLIAFSRNREGNREENPSPSPKCLTIHQTGLLIVDTSQGHSLGMFLIIGWCATDFAWEEQVKKHGKKRGLWQFLAQRFYWGLFLFFVLFCFNESLLSCCQLWSKSSCTKSLNFPLHRDTRLHHPRLKCHERLFPAGDAEKLTPRHCTGEAETRASQELQSRSQPSSSSAHPFQSNHHVCISPQAPGSDTWQKEKGKREI